MDIPSGGSTVTVRYIQLTDLLSASRSELAKRYLRRVALKKTVQSPMLSENRPETFIRLPALARWLARVEQRIEDSVAPVEAQEAEPGRWLSERVADAGLHFFRSAADLLPNEPFIYASKEGDLVAEFEAPRGMLTSVISPAFTILFANADGKIFEAHLGSNASNAVEPLRDELKKLKQILVAGPDGAVAATDG